MDKVINPSAGNASPFFSIIIPTKDRERQLGRCLDSVMNQTCSSYEIILVNDGEDFAFAFPRFNADPENLVLLNSGRNGVSAARNMGMKESNGKYLIFLDDDEYLESDHLKTLLGFYADETNKNTICKTGTLLVKEDGTKIKEGHFTSESYLLAQVWKYGASMSDYCFPVTIKGAIVFEKTNSFIEDFLFINKALSLFPSAFIATYSVIIEDHSNRISYQKFNNSRINYFHELSAIEGAIGFQITHSKSSPVPILICVNKIIGCTYSYFKSAIKNRRTISALRIIIGGFLSIIKISCARIY